ncbi:MAG TPA: DUF3090 family protein [Aggregatilineales bacterium]|nr:DUF3090 family protein [Aggregatilineales bacterium]
MAHVEIELNPVDFVTVGTVGPKGRRKFYLQAGRASQLVSLVIEKEQARALSEAVKELLDDLNKQRGSDLSSDAVDMTGLNMDLRDPIEPQFQVAQMGLGYDETQDLVVLVAQELVVVEEEQDPLLPENESTRPGVARFWGTRQQMRALASHAAEVVKQGRVDPQSNGRILYYWT